MGVRLPSEYQEVEYIESDGMQSIQTDVLPSNSIGFDCTFLTKSDVSAVNYGCIFGSRISSGIRDFQLTTWVGSAGGSLRFGPAQTCSAGITKGKLMSASLRNRVFANASGTIVTLHEYNWKDDAVPIALFLLRSATNYTQGGHGCRIYVIRFYDGDNLIRDYVPCYRKSDGTIGMYELITGAFLTNATVGAESFTKGPDVIDSISPWLVARRRMMMAILGGDDLKKKVFTGVTCATNELEITHNLGVIPKLIVVEDDKHGASIADYLMGEIFYAVFAPVEAITFQNRMNGVIACRNRSSGNQSTTAILQIGSNPGLAQYTVSTTSLLVWNPISNGDWTYAESYTVTLYY